MLDHESRCATNILGRRETGEPHVVDPILLKTRLGKRVADALLAIRVGQSENGFGGRIAHLPDRSILFHNLIGAHIRSSGLMEIKHQNARRDTRRKTCQYESTILENRPRSQPNEKGHEDCQCRKRTHCHRHANQKSKPKMNQKAP